MGFVFFIVLPWLAVALRVFSAVSKGKPVRDMWSEILIGVSVGLFPSIFWLVRMQGPFFGGADIGAGLIVMFSSVVLTPVVWFAMVRHTQAALAIALRRSALVVAIWIGISGLNTALLFKQEREYRAKSELNCERLPVHCFLKAQAARIEPPVLAGTQFERSALEAKDGWDRTPLHYALAMQFSSSNSKLEVIKYLIAQGASVQFDVEHPNHPFLLLTQSQDFESSIAILKLLTSAGFSLNQKFGPPKQMTFLGYLVLHENWRWVDYFLDQGADPSLKDDFGYSACERLTLHKLNGTDKLKVACSGAQAIQ